MKATVYYQSLSCDNLACEHLTHQVAKKPTKKDLAKTTTPMVAGKTLELKSFGTIRQIPSQC